VCWEQITLSVGRHVVLSRAAAVTSVTGYLPSDICPRPEMRFGVTGLGLCFEVRVIGIKVSVRVRVKVTVRGPGFAIVLG